MLCIGGRKSRNKVIVGEPAIGSFILKNLVSGRILLLGVRIVYISLIGSGDTSAQLATKDETYLVNMNEL